MEAGAAITFGNLEKLILQFEEKKVCNMAKYIMIKFLAVVDGCGRQGWSNRARESWN